VSKLQFAEVDSYKVHFLEYTLWVSVLEYYLFERQISYFLFHYISVMVLE